MTKVHDSTNPTLADGDPIGSSQPEQRQVYDYDNSRDDEAEMADGYGDTPPGTQFSRRSDG